MIKFEKYRLGETDEDILIETSEECILASHIMARQATRTIDIISHLLDPVIYDHQEFIDAIKAMVLNSRKSRVRILVRDPGRIVKHGHRLVNLAHILSSFIEIRVPGKEHELINESVLIVDETGYIYRKSSERYEGKLNFSDKRASRLLTHEFEQMWEKSRSDPNLKRALL